MQYTISNLNAFILLISIGFSLYPFIYDDAVDNSMTKKQQYIKLLDRNNSPIQLISQIKGYFYINPVLALSLAITLFSLVGIPPLIGFFAKQMVLSAALDSGYVFLTLIAILTSVVSAVYYLGVLKQVFFYEPEYKLNPAFESITLFGSVITVNHPLVQKIILFFYFSTPKKQSKKLTVKKITFKVKNIVLSSYLTITVSSLTLILLLFIFTPQEWLSLANILALIMFNP